MCILSQGRKAVGLGKHVRAWVIKYTQDSMKGVRKLCDTLKKQPDRALGRCPLLALGHAVCGADAEGIPAGMDVAARNVPWMPCASPTRSVAMALSFSRTDMYVLSKERFQMPLARPSVTLTHSPRLTLWFPKNPKRFIMPI